MERARQGSRREREREGEGEEGGGGLVGKLCSRTQINLALLAAKFSFSSG